ncbi:MAG: phosphoribosylanthranilate isomerase [Longimicrobiales bacterium]
MIPRVKLCGLTRAGDARAAVEAGVGYLGVVMVPTSPRSVSAEAVRTLRDGIDVPLVLVTADRDPDRLAEHARSLKAGGLQLHGDESPEDVQRLREAGDWEIWKSVRVREARDLAEAVERFGGLVDAFHLDGWHPERLGGTGVRFPWRAVAEMRERLPEGTELVAAGGLTPENVGVVIDLLRPDVVDVSSGVEFEGRPGVKDPEKVRAFVRAARSVTAT